MESDIKKPAPAGSLPLKRREMDAGDFAAAEMQSVSASDALRKIKIASDVLEHHAYTRYSKDEEAAGRSDTAAIIGDVIKGFDKAVALSDSATTGDISNVSFDRECWCQAGN